MQDLNKIIEEYENLDTTDFPMVEPKAINKIRERKAKFLESQNQILGFEPDVANWLSHQDSMTKNYVNGMVKNYMNFKNQGLANVG